MAFVRALVAYAVVVALVVVGVQKASTHPSWGPLLKPYLEVISAALSPGSVSGGARAAQERVLLEEKVSTTKVETKIYVNGEPWPSDKPLPPELEDALKNGSQKTVVIKREWPLLMICSPGGAYYVHPEVSRAVCDDHSLGVPFREAQRLSYDELWARVNALRDRYLAQKKEQDD